MDAERGMLEMDVWIEGELIRARGRDDGKRDIKGRV